MISIHLTFLALGISFVGSPISKLPANERRQNNRPKSRDGERQYVAGGVGCKRAHAADATPIATRDWVQGRKHNDAIRG